MLSALRRWFRYAAALALALIGVLTIGYLRTEPGLRERGARGREALAAMKGAMAIAEERERLRDEHATLARRLDEVAPLEIRPSLILKEISRRAGPSIVFDSLIIEK